MYSLNRAHEKAADGSGAARLTEKEVMKDFTGKVAVITGGGGIGRAMAERFARAGMKVVLADIEEPALAQTAESIKATGGMVLAVPTDVSKASDVETLAQKACETFGAVHLLCKLASRTFSESAILPAPSEDPCRIDIATGDTTSDANLPPRGTAAVNFPIATWE
ncbi:MAG: SDR family NAD(P)-dependent oxidoreductase [Candidatus Binatia bacterium]